MAEINERVNNLENRVNSLEEDVKDIKSEQDKFFNKIIRRFDNLDGKMTKMTKWIYRLLGVIIVLLLVIAVKSPSTALDILSSSATVVKAI